LRKKQLVFLGMDLEYSKKLSEYLRKQDEDYFDIRIYSDLNIFIEKEEENNVDVLFMGENIYVANMSNISENDGIDNSFFDVKTKSIKVLASEKNSQIKEEYFIYKYQSAYDIYMALINACIDEAIDKNSINKSKKSKLVGVYSPVNRSYKTSFSYMYASIISKNQKVLYLNLEAFSGIGDFLFINQERNITDLMYEFRANRNLFNIIMSRYIDKSGNLSIVLPAENLSDIQKVSASDWVDFIDYLTVNSDYEVIVIDIGNNVSGIMDILTLCDDIYSPVREDSLSRLKMDHFLKMLNKYYGRSDIKDRIIILEIPFFERAKDGFDNMLKSEMYEYTRQKIYG